MTMDVGDKRLIEDLIPVGAINAVAQREKIGHAALHPRKLHLWWARRPLAAARAAVYATLVPADGTPEEARSDEFFTSLCQWGASDRVIAEARERVLAANGGKPPRVLDMFAGGGAIPLEAARLGCEATAVELNPVAHLIERCTLDYPQRFGPASPTTCASTADAGSSGRGSASGISTRACASRRASSLGSSTTLRPSVRRGGRSPTCGRARCRARTGRAAHTSCRSCARPGWRRRRAATSRCGPSSTATRERVRWEVVEARRCRRPRLRPRRVLEPRPRDLPGLRRRRRRRVRQGAGARRADGDHAARGRAGQAERARAGLPAGRRLPGAVGRGVRGGARGTRRGAADEPICTYHATLGSASPPYGLTRFRDLFTPRQLATLCAFAQGVREAHVEMLADGMEPERARRCARISGSRSIGSRSQQHPLSLGHTQARTADEHVRAPGAADGLGLRRDQSLRRARWRRRRLTSRTSPTSSSSSRERAGASRSSAPRPRSSPTTTPLRRRHHRPAVLRQHLLRRPLRLLLRLAQALGRLPVRGALRR